MLRYILIAALAAIYILFGTPSYLLEQSWASALSYPFFHANLVHLIVNCIALWLLFDPKRKGNFRQMLFGLAVSLLVYPCALHAPVGFSNALYAVIGLRTPSFSSPWWKKPEVIIFLVVTFAMLLLPQLSGFTHILSMAIGIAVAALGRFIRKINNDAKESLR